VPSQKTALIAANDWLAIGLTGLQSQGPELRAQAEMFSFDGLELARRPELGIRSMAVPMEALARDAVAELVRLRRPGAVGRAIRYALGWADASP
jgi:DNA-binding LacI/PurR family transcriptional regulator